MSSELAVTWRSTSDPTTYEEARVGRVFNQRRPARYPHGVVTATNQQDIVQAVRLAREKGYRVAVRSGGHSWAAWSVRDDSILVDLGSYQSIEVDTERGIARVSPSTTGRQLNAKLNPLGWMFGGGHCPDVGLGGFLLQGGMGWNCRNWGWACERVLGVDVVTAEGNLIHCSATENEQLYWAVRGAGPGFPAIVTCFHLELRRLVPAMRATTLVFSKEQYRPAMDWVTKLIPSLDTASEVVCVGATPPGETVSRIIVHVIAFSADEPSARESLAPFNDPPVQPLKATFNYPTSLDKEYNDQAIANPSGHRYCAENAFIQNDADVTDVLESAFTKLPNAKTFALWFAMAPCSRKSLPDMALSLQSDHYFALYTIWEDVKDDERMQQWVQGIMVDVEKHSEGAYLGDSDFQIRRTRFWGEQEGKQLMNIRRAWDPTSIFCGYLDVGDKSRQNGLDNVHEWK